MNRIHFSKSRHFLFTCAIALGVTTASTAASSSEDSESRSRLFRSIAAEQLVGQPVTNDAWEHVARIDGVLIDPDSGRIAVTLLSRPGQEALSAVPWSALDIDARGAAHLTISQEELRRAPTIYRANGSGYRADRSGSEANRYREPLPRLATFSRQRRIGSVPDRAVEGTTLVSGILAGTIVASFDEDEPQVVALVDTEVGTVRAKLGPENRISALGVNLEPGAPVTIMGESRVEGSEIVIVAFELIADGETVRLRD